MTKKRLTTVFSLLFALLLISTVAGLAFGSVSLEVNEVISAIFKGGGSTSAFIVRTLRLPRVLGAILAGAALSSAGLLLQSATDNDLCAPNVIGVNAGAGFAVMTMLCFFSMKFYLLPVAAFLGAFLTTLLVLGISQTAGGHRGKTTILLAGVAVAAILNAGISFLAQLYPDILASYTAFSTGGFNGVYMDDIAVPSVIIITGIILAWFLTPRLNLLCLGDELAGSLGVKVSRLRMTALILASALCASAVTFAGLLGFVGLLVPHMARKMAGHDLRVLLPVSVLTGSILVLLSDILGRTLFAPAELSAGILLSILGSPFFLFLLYKRRRGND